MLKVTDMTTLETLVEELKALPSEKLAVAAHYVRHLTENTLSERRTVLERLAGSWTQAEAAEMESALRECRRIDPREWQCPS